MGIRAKIKRSISFLAVSFVLFSYQNCSRGFESNISSEFLSQSSSLPEVYLTSQPAALTQATAAAFTFNVQGNPYVVVTNVKCSLDGANAIDCMNGFNASALSDGDHQLLVEAVDSKNNHSMPLTYSWKIDSTKPMVVFVVAPSAVIGTKNLNATYSATDSLAGIDSVTCTLDNATVICADGIIALTNLTETIHELKIVAKDKAGNISDSLVKSVRVDLTAPTVTITKNPSATTNQASATFNFTGIDEGQLLAKFVCAIDGGAFAACDSGQATYNMLKEGSHAFSVKAIDTVGNLSAEVTAAWSIDLTPPAVPTITLNQPAVTTVTTIQFTFSSASTDVNAATGYSCSLDAATAAICTSPLTRALSEGTHTLKVTATDRTGNISAEATTTITIQAAVTPTPTPTPVVSPPAPVGNAPAWFVNAAEGAWTQIATATGQKISDVLPNPVPGSSAAGGSVFGSPGGITSAWTGGAVDQNRNEYMFCANGGHADYAGNECYALSVSASTPAWRRLSDPTPQKYVDPVYNLITPNPNPNAAVYTDGRPRSMHSSFECWGDGQVWFPLQNAHTSQAGDSSDSVVSFNRDALGDALSPLAWTLANIGPWVIHPKPTFKYYGSVRIFGVCAWDRVNHKVWALGGNSVNNTSYWSVDTTGATIGQTKVYEGGQNFGNWGGWVSVAHDLRILIAGDTYKNAITVLNLDDPTSWQVVSNVTGPGYYAQGSGGVYIAANHSVGVGFPKEMGGNIYKLQIPTKVLNGKTVYDSAGQWSWTLTKPAGSQPYNSSTGGNNYAYSKWNIIENMGNGQSAIVITPEYNGPTYIYKVPKAGL